MISRALNSGALNKVPFPSSETGLSIIELLGTVEVTGSIPAISLRLTATAATAPSAVSSSTPKMKVGVGAATSCVATPSTIVENAKIKLYPTAKAAAIASAGNLIKHTVEAAVAPTASTSATSYQKAKNGATATATATTSVGSVNEAYRGATTSSISSALVKLFLTKRGVAFSQVAEAKASAGIAIKTRPGASTVATASATSDSQVYVFRSAASAPAAVGSVSIIRKIKLYPDPLASIGNGTATPKLIAKNGATAVSAAECAPAGFYFNLTTPASAVATAIAYAAGLDFATKLPAPFERQIVVPPYDRTMKVVV